jgi:hypothetical protein
MTELPPLDGAAGHPRALRQERQRPAHLDELIFAPVF